jgi:LemA protein
MENLIADRREFYNDSVLLYNTRIASVPDSFFAAIFGMKPKEYFRATDDEKKTVNAAF